VSPMDELDSQQVRLGAVGRGIWRKGICL